MKSLRKFNLIMGSLHLIQAIIMLILATSVIQTIAEFKPVITQNYLTYDVISQSLVTASRELFTLPFGILVSLFLFLSAFAHFLVSVPNKSYLFYEKNLNQHMNPFRWFEYGLSSSLMIVLISTLFGVYDIASLLLIFFINFSMNMFGLLMEQINSKRDKKTWAPFIYGAIAGLIPWIVIFLYMTGTKNYDMVPWFVWAIIGTYFVMYHTFPINMILQYLGIGRWKDYFYGERVYMILSLVAKTLLAWLVLFGAMQP